MGDTRGSLMSVATRRLIVLTLTVTPSGALSPGVLSASAVVVGMAMGFLGGFLVALGHMVFELPYVASLAYSATRLRGLLDRLEKPLSLIVLAAAAYFAIGLVLDAFHRLTGHGGSQSIQEGLLVGSYGPLGALAAGIVFTAANPYFLLWWVTIGLPLVREAVVRGAKGFTVMYVSHVWMDYAWLAILAAAGGMLQETILYPYVLVLLAALLIYFSATIVLKAWRSNKHNPLYVEV